MQLSRTLKRLADNAADVDVATLSGADAVALLRLVNPSVSALLALRDALAARAVEANQHHVVGSRSGSSFIGSETGVSERSARSMLSRQKALAGLPDVRERVRTGELSGEKADIITSAAADDLGLAHRLLDQAVNSSVEDLRQRAADQNAFNRARRQRLRDSQFISITHNADNMVLGQFKLLADVAAPWLGEWRRQESQHSTSADKAEAFSQLIGSTASKPTATVSFHVNVDVPDLVTMTGGGVVTADVMAPYFDEASLQLLIKAKNKLVWYSESRNHRGPLAEFIKRAVKAFDYDKCSVEGCVDFAQQVDHIQARTNGGANALQNLQSLCVAHHHVKTKQDAPWTTGGIYAKTHEKWRQVKERASRSPGDERDVGPSGEMGDDREVTADDAQLFPDTG